MKNIKEKLENQLAALKRESKDVVSEMQANEQISAAYDSVGKFRSATGTDKMLNATRDGLQESREKAAGAKVLYQSSRDGKLDKANANNQTEFGVQLSANRAQTVANYLASQGIDQNRLIVTGSGNAKYQADKAAGALSSDASVYQSTDISFMRIEN